MMNVEQFMERELARETEVTAPLPLCAPQIPRPDLGSNPGHHGGKPATNCLSYGMAYYGRYVQTIRRTEERKWMNSRFTIFSHKRNKDTMMVPIYQIAAWSNSPHDHMIIVSKQDAEANIRI
jgi:hypothetical protein